MSDAMVANRTIELQVKPLSQEAYKPYGSIVGLAPDAPEQDKHFRSETSSFWQAHVFRGDESGNVEFVWVDYPAPTSRFTSIESHMKTEQAIIPISGTPLIQVVAPPSHLPMEIDSRPDLDQMEAFLLDGSLGVVMRVGCWHSQIPLMSGSCLFVTREATTREIVMNKRKQSALRETIVLDLEELGVTDLSLVF